MAAEAILYGLLKHEHKEIFLHFAVQQNKECEGSIKRPSHVVLRAPQAACQPCVVPSRRGGGKGASTNSKGSYRKASRPSLPP
ncbi:hypothetical protein BDR05DRAFT_1062458 [Suillus weaverae]|nr:hypothetical protein BDR05DRAFT_1062458 [Suillus weaverae]